MDFNIGLCSVESQETSSEGSFLSAAKTHKSNNSKRQRHIPWSHEEVLQLVNGVSKHGVGKWTDIKKVSFPLSPHRSAVDLKVFHILVFHCSAILVQGLKNVLVLLYSGQMAKSCES